MPLGALERCPRPPLDYAITQANKGLAHKALGEIEQALACWREAEKYYRQMDMTKDADKMRHWIEEAGGESSGVMKGGGPGLPPEEKKVADLVLAFINADNWDESQRIVTENREQLLSEEADNILTTVIERARADGNEGAAQVAELHRALLRRCREIGIEAAFEELKFFLRLAAVTVTAVKEGGQTKEELTEVVRNDIPQRQDDPAMVALLEAILRLLEGEPVEDIRPELEGMHAECWRRIVEGVSDGG